MSKLTDLYERVDEDTKADVKDELKNLVNYMQVSATGIKNRFDDLMNLLDKKMTVEEYETRNVEYIKDSKTAFDKAYKSSKYINSLCDEFGIDPELFTGCENRLVFQKFMTNMMDFALEYKDVDDVGVADADCDFDYILDNSINALQNGEIDLTPDATVSLSAPQASVYDGIEI